MTKFKELDRVACHSRLEAGVIVHVYPGGTHFEVEFPGNILMTIPERDLLPLVRDMRRDD
jgi:hypothetical protein